MLRQERVRTRDGRNRPAHDESMKNISPSSRLRSVAVESGGPWLLLLAVVLTAIISGCARLALV